MFLLCSLTSAGVNAVAAITPKMALRLEKAIGSNADHWLRLQAAYDLAQLRMRPNPIDVKRLTPKAA